MTVPIFQVDAFAVRLFEGNPAAVLCVETFPSDETMQNIAAENNLAETAFLAPESGEYWLRWFTPTVEVPLCGHATLASAAVVMERLERGRDKVVFHTRSGPLLVERAESGYRMDFPALPCTQVTPPETMAEALGVTPVEVFANAFNYLALLDSPQAVRELTPDMVAIARLDRDGVVVTSFGDRGYDFVSRYFAPAKGIPEDPVTGGAHCMLAPYWASRLNKSAFKAFQASRRGGEVRCLLAGDRVELYGGCIFYSEGAVQVLSA